MDVCPKCKEFEKYSIASLIDTFHRHAEEVELMRKNLIDRFNENYPGESLPEHYKDEFNLSRALLSICCELDLLKRENMRDYLCQEKE